MSAINANIIVEPITLNVTETSITQTVTVDPINLSVFTSAGTTNPPGSPNASLQFNNGNLFGGLANATVSGGNLTFTNLANLKIDGGATGYQLTTDGAGVLSWTPGTSDPTKIVNGTSNVEIPSVNGNVDFTVASANVARMYTTGAAYTGFLAVNGNITAKNNIEVESGAEFAGDGNSIQWADASNVAINGGVNGYVLGTDGAGSLSWVAQGGSGTGNPGGSNTNVQFNDAGLFGGNAGFTFNNVSGLVNMPGGLVVGNDITAPAGLLTINSANIAGNILVGGTTTIQQAQEKVDLNATPATGTINFNLLDQAIVLQTADATANFTLNFRGNATTTLDTIMSAGQSMTCTYINENGITPFTLSGVEIDSTSQTIEYYNNIPPGIGTTNEKDYYTFNIIKTASATFTVLGTTGSIV